MYILYLTYGIFIGNAVIDWGNRALSTNIAIQIHLLNSTNPLQSRAIKMTGRKNISFRLFFILKFCIFRIIIQLSPNTLSPHE